jgi:hypothetical protein
MSRLTADHLDALSGWLSSPGRLERLAPVRVELDADRERQFVADLLAQLAGARDDLDDDALDLLLAALRKAAAAAEAEADPAVRGLAAALLLDDTVGLICHAWEALRVQDGRGDRGEFEDGLRGDLPLLDLADELRHICSGTRCATELCSLARAVDDEQPCATRARRSAAPRGPPHGSRSTRGPRR